jgi:phage recombination protein Bet
MSGEVAVREFPPDQVDLIRRTIAAGATDDELALFVGQCKRTGLDPFSRQIHFVKRSGKMTIQTGIDGYRLIADRTGLYAGNDDPIFDDEAKPRRATVTVWKLVQGVRCPFTSTARWEQYYPGETQGFMWKKMPHLMLGKCAEALALRKAFPHELSGIYTTDEMESPEEVQAPARPAIHGTISQAQGKVLADLMIATGDTAAAREALFSRYQIVRLGELPADHYSDARAFLARLPKPPVQPEAPKPAVKKWHLQVSALLSRLKTEPENVTEFLAGFEVLSVEELTEVQAKQAIEELTHAIAQKEEREREAAQFEREQAEMANH